MRPKTLNWTAEALERVKKHWSRHRGVVTKYLKETKHILESNAKLDEKCLVKLKALSEILNEKFALLNTLGEEVLAAWPTVDIEREIEEAEDVRCKIAQK